jgi:hypothetical protein
MNVILWHIVLYSIVLLEIVLSPIVLSLVRLMKNFALLLGQNNDPEHAKTG